MNKKIILLSLISCIFFIFTIALSSNPQNITKQQAAHSSASSIDQSSSSSSIAYFTASEAAHAPLTYQTSSSLSSLLSAAYTSSSSDNTDIPNRKSNLRCAFCSEKLKSTSDKTKHEWDIHRKETNLNCNKCQLSYKHSSSFASHMKMHATQTAAGNAQQSSQSSSNNTDILKKNTNLRLRCSFCSKEFESTKKKDIHQWEMHRKETDYNCEICQLSYKRKSSFSGHMKMHAAQAAAGNAQQSLQSSANNTDILTECSFCSHEFESKEEKDKHQWDKHRKETNYNCEKCQLSYKRKSFFNDHMKMHTARVLDDLALLSQSNANKTVPLSSSSSSSAAAITASATAMPSSSSAITVDKAKGTKRKASHTDGTAPDKKGVKKRKQK